MTNRQKVRIILFWRIWWDSEPPLCGAMSADFFLHPAQSISSPPCGGLEGVRAAKGSFNNKRTA